MIAIKNILVATDFSEPADAAPRYGRAFASPHRPTPYSDELRLNVIMQRESGLLTNKARRKDRGVRVAAPSPRTARR